MIVQWLNGSVNWQMNPHRNLQRFPGYSNFIVSLTSDINVAYF